jgi:hypothetical protein
MDHRLVADRAKKQDGECYQFAQWLSDYRQIAEVAARYAKVEAEPKQNPLNLENQFYQRWMRYCTDHSRETANFLAEKRVRDPLVYT